MLGVSKKIKLKFTNITSISKTKVMAIFNSGIIIVTQDSEKYKFGSFGNRDVALNRILALWKSGAP